MPMMLKQMSIVHCDFHDFDDVDVDFDMDLDVHVHDILLDIHADNYVVHFNANN